MGGGGGIDGGGRVGVDRRGGDTEMDGRLETGGVRTSGEGEGAIGSNDADPSGGGEEDSDPVNAPGGVGGSKG